jgi:hypothetical protein
MNPHPSDDHYPKVLLAAENMDWQQVVMNGGPPCFHVSEDDGHFCGRAKRWDGHDGVHAFVSLADMLRDLNRTNS